MSTPVQLETVFEAAKVFEKLKTVKATGDELGFSPRTLYNYLAILENSIGTKALKSEFPRCYDARHPKLIPTKSKMPVEDHFIEPAPPKPQQKLSEREVTRGVGKKSTSATIQKSILSDVRRRINTKMKAPSRPQRAMTDVEAKDAVGTALAQVMFYIDAETLGKAKLSELSQMFKTLFEAKQLLDGKPTTILSRTDKADLESLVPRLIAEAKKRGFSFNKDVAGELIEGAK